MTKASPARIRRKLGRGRPPKEIREDPDPLAAEFALALEDAWKISQRRAIDLVIAWFDSRVVPASKTPRGAKDLDGLLVGYETSPARTFAGRASVLRRKAKHARPAVVKILTVVLRCRDIDGAARLLGALLQLASVATPEQVRKAIQDLLKSGREAGWLGAA
jgi:hypothetical protein